MGGSRTLGIVVLAVALLLASMPLQTGRVFATAGKPNGVADSSFENPASTSWFEPAGATYGNGTVRIHDTSQPHEGSYSALLSAVNKTACGALECKDTVRATVQQYVQFNSLPTLNNLANASDSFSAWWYVDDIASTGLPAYSLHIGLAFNDNSGIEYFYGMSDLSNKRYNLGPILTGHWFQMRRDLLADVQGVVANPSSTRITTLWFAAFGGTNQSVAHGEIAWVDDAALSFNGGPVAAFSSRPASGSAPLTVNFDASQSVEIGGLGTVMNYTWSFGDGLSLPNSESSTASHTYRSPGDFTVALTVTDSNGLVASSSSIVRVGPADLTIPLIVGGGGGLLLMGGLFFTRFRRKQTVKRVKPKLRKG